MRLPHVTPFAHTPIYFFTACTAGRRRLLANEKSLGRLREIWEKSATLDGWFVGRFVLMPDHTHFFAAPSSEAKSRASWLKMWKSVSARRLTAEFGLSRTRAVETSSTTQQCEHQMVCRAGACRRA
jgi:putative transposase